MAPWESTPEVRGTEPVRSEHWRNATWMLEQARTVESAKEQLDIARQAMQAEQTRLAEFIRDVSGRQDWLQLTGDQVDYVISQMSDGAGSYGLES